MKKLLFLGVLILFLIGTVSAFEIDNVKNYDEDTRTITIENAFGLPLIGSDIATIKLNTPLNYYVPRGYQKVAEFELSLFSDYETAFKELELYHRVGMVKFERDYDYKYKTIIQVPDYKTVCDEGLTINGTVGDINCRQEQIGLKDEVVWNDLVLFDFKENDVLIIGIFTDVQKGDQVEWIPNFFGERIDEWAIWTEELNVDLVSYFKLDGLSGDVNDSIQNFNGTNTGATRGAVGIINNSFSFDGGSDYITLSGSGGITPNDDVSLQAWIKVNTLDTITQYIISKSGSISTNKDYSLAITATTDLVQLVVFQGNTGYSVVSTSAIQTGQWYHVVGTWDDTANKLRLYINGILNNTASPSLTRSKTALNLVIGKFADGSSNYFDGKIDEVGIWNRNLTATEVTQLYNGGTGITWVDVFGPIITLNSPIDTFNSSSSTINFNGTVTSATLINVSLIIDGVLNETNTSGITGDYLFTKTILDGNYNWTYEGCDSSGCLNGTVRTFTIDATDPFINITSISNNTTYTSNYTATPNITVQLNWTTTDDNLDTCWFYNITSGANETLACGNNATLVLNYSTHTFLVYANDTSGNNGSASVIATWNYIIFQENNYFNSTTIETSTESFIVDLTANSSLTAVTLDYNGTNYSMSQLGTNWTASFDVPLDKLQNNTLIYSLAYAGDTIYSDYFYQNVSPLNLSSCYTETPYINFTFKDETTNSFINASIDASTWVYWLGAGSVTKSLLFSNSTENPYYAFCLNGTNETLHNTRSIQYAAAGYPQRKYDASDDLTNITTNKLLWLLSSSDGIYSTIQVVDTQGDKVSGVDVTVERQFSGVWTIIGQEVTDDAGAVTFWLNPDYNHRFTFVSDDCVGTSVTIRPTQTQYTQQLQCDGTGEDFVSQLEGLKYFRTPIEGIIQTGVTNFTYFVTSSKYTITNASFQIVNSSNSAVLNSTSLACASDECLLSLLYDVQAGDDIKGRYYVDFGNGSILLESDARWVNVVIDTAGKAGLSTFWSDLRYVIDDWGEGSNTGDFNRIVVVFFFMALAISFLNYHFGIDTQNPGAFMFILTGVILSGSLVGGLDGQGFFYYNNLSSVQFVNNYILAFFMIIISVSYFIQVNVQAKR